MLSRLRRPFGFAIAAGLALALMPDPARAQVVVKVNDTVNFRLGFQLQAWADWLQDPISEGYQQSLFIRRVRFLLAGNLAKNVSFFMQTDNPNMGKTSARRGEGDQYRPPHAGRVRRVESVRQRPVHYGRGQDADALHAQFSPVARRATCRSTAARSRSCRARAEQGDAGRDVGFQVKSYLADNHLEFRGGVFDGFRAPANAGGAGSRNSFRFVGRAVYNFCDTEMGYVPVGTNLGKRKIIAIGGGFDTQGSYNAYGGDFMLDLPFGTVDPVKGTNSLTAHVDYIHYDGGCGLNAGEIGARDQLPAPDPVRAGRDLHGPRLLLRRHAFPAVAALRVGRLHREDRFAQELPPLHGRLQLLRRPAEPEDHAGLRADRAERQGRGDSGRRRTRTTSSSSSSSTTSDSSVPACRAAPRKAAARQPPGLTRRGHVEEDSPRVDPPRVREAHGRRGARHGRRRELPVSRPRGGAAEDPEDRPVEPLRARLRQVVRQHVHQGMGREEQDQRRRGPHRHRRDQRPRGRRGRGQEGARPLHVPVAAGGLREAGHRPRRDLRGGREEARQEDRPRAQVHVQPEDEEVLRLLGFLRPRPGQLPQGPVGEGRVPQRPRHLG